MTARDHKTLDGAGGARYIVRMRKVEDEGPVTRPSGRLWIGAPALMLLACATAHASDGDRDVLDEATLRACVVDLDWVIKSGTAHSVRQVRWVLARRAAFLIATLDRIHAAPPCQSLGTLEAGGDWADGQAPVPRRCRDLDPARSNHQHSAP